MGGRDSIPCRGKLFPSIPYRFWGPLAYSLTRKMEAVHSSETQVNFHRTTQCCIPEDNTLHTTVARTINPRHIHIYISFVSYVMDNLLPGWLVAWDRKCVLSVLTVPPFPPENMAAVRILNLGDKLHIRV
jgi:hypothetical protein